MRPDDVYRHLRRQPFRTLRFTLTDGRTYEVRHPELVMVGRSTVITGFPQASDPEPVFDRTVDVSLLHIMEIEPLETPAAPTNNQ